MGSINIPVAQLNSSKTIPLLGFGTAVSGASHETIRDSVIQAIELGYRHFDSASVYHTELPLGDAIAEALRRGLIKSRDELFITSKLWTSDAHPDHVLPALQKSLRNLKLEYLDLYLVHWPVSSKPGELYFPVRKEEVLPMDIKSVWEAMEKCQELGLTRSIGVSNFSCKKLEFLLATSKIPPAVNQVEMHPMWQQKKLREFCKEKGIHVSAYSPLGAVGTSWGTNLVMDNEVLKEIANANGKSVAQVCLRWGYEQGISVIVKSFNKERMANNLDIFHWKLSPEDLQKISQLPHHKTNSGAYFISDEGPIKSLEEFWDGEI